MYHFRAVKPEDMDRILELYKFDLDLSEKPRFYIMTKGDNLVTFTKVSNRNKGNFIDYIYMNNLNEDEIDFFYRSLVYLLGNEYPLYSKYKSDTYTKVENGMNRVELPKKSKCHGS